MASADKCETVRGRFGHFLGLLKLIRWRYAIDCFAVDGFLTVGGVAGL